MNFADMMLRQIDGRMLAIAGAALAKPQGRDAFEYGRMCGHYAGLHDAREILVAMLAEEDDKDI